MSQQEFGKECSSIPQTWLKWPNLKNHGGTYENIQNTRKIRCYSMADCDISGSYKENQRHYLRTHFHYWTWTSNTWMLEKNVSAFRKHRGQGLMGWLSWDQNEIKELWIERKTFMISQRILQFKTLGDGWLLMHESY